MTTSVLEKHIWHTRIPLSV